ncbi:MAG: S41 family peptidase, partial [Acidimicrobiia bacterium]
MGDTGYLRFPSIQGDTVVLVAEDDIWSVPLEGGPARRLTASLGEVSHPALSPDASLIAFTSREEHHPEVYCMPSSGGPARRITWFGAISHVRGWTAEGEILFAADAQTPFRHLIHLYTVAPEGGSPRRLDFGPAREAAFGPDGAVVLGLNTADPARWKRYRGGTAGELWIDPQGTGSFQRLLTLPGNLASPMWLGARVYFLSDHEGVGNLYSCRPEGHDLRRHSSHAEYYARFAKTDGVRIVYQHAAEVWVCDPEADTTRRVEVSLNSPRARRNRRFVPAERYLSDYALHPRGHSVAIHSRGKLFTMPLFEQAVRQHGQPDGVRYKLARWIGDGSSLVMVSDQGGDDAIEVHPEEPSATPKRLAGLDLGCITDLATP